MSLCSVETLGHVTYLAELNNIVLYYCKDFLVYKSDIELQYLLSLKTNSIAQIIHFNVKGIEFS